MSALMSFSSVKTFALPVFSQETSAITNVSWRGEPLITGDTINYLEPKTFAAGKVRTATLGDGSIVNTISEDPNLPYRKEVGVRPDRVELTVQVELPAYHNDLAKPSLTYSFDVPLRLLAGMKWKAVIGQSSAISTVQGTLTDKTADGNLTTSSVRWIGFEGNGKHITFDFNPAGLSAYKPGSNGLAVMWDVQKVGDKLCFSFGRKVRFWGGVFTGKVIIREESPDNYLNHHSGNLYNYFWVLPARYNYCFASKAPNKDFTAAGRQAYDKTLGFGWESTSDFKKIGAVDNSLVYTAITGEKSNTFICKVDQPGLYIVRVLASNVGESEYGPFAVSSNGRPQAKDITVSPGKIKTVIFSEWLPAGDYRLTLDGSWIISGLSLQMLLHQDEDLLFNRRTWLVDQEFEPTPILSSQFYRQPATYKVAVMETDLPPQKVVEPKSTPTLPEKAVLLPNPKNPNLAWRYEGFIGGMGPDNNGTFLEFDTTEKITRRLKELKAQGVNIVMLNGFLARHCHEEHSERIQKTVKEIVRIAHGMNMHVLDHQDLTVIWNVESALRHMVAHIDRCQQTIDTDTVIEGWCPLNPDLRKASFAWMKQYIDDTNIDGIMIDEVCYHKAVSCGCPYCRAEFTRETGLTLPIGENAKSFAKRTSLLYRAWLQWRKKAIGDWWIAFRKEALPDRPDFCIMGYMSESGVQSDYGSYNFAYDLFEMARSNDFVGTEIMSRNVMDNFRYVFSSRRLYNVFRQEYGSPVFGLVYHMENEYFAYFGWAMNNMMGQATWDMSPLSVRKDTPDFLQWKENMNRQSAQPSAEIAIVFSVKSRDLSSLGFPGTEALGISQILSDNHIQHLFLTDRSLSSADRLKSYRLVILPNAPCLSDDEIKTLRDYVNNGGHVFITGYSGLLDGYGTLRKEWGLAELTAAEISAKTVYPVGVQLSLNEGNLSASYAAAQKLPVITVSNDSGVKVLAGALAANGKVLGPVCIARPLGKGMVFYSSALLGAANYQEPIKNGDAWKFELNQPLAEMLKRLLLQAVDEKTLTFKAVQMPPTVISSLWKDAQNGNPKTYVHLLNATGVRLKKGEAVPNAKSLPAFPPLDQDIVFEITLPSFTQAHVTSADYSGHQPVKVKKIGDHRYRVTVPKEALRAYAMVVLE